MADRRAVAAVRPNLPAIADAVDAIAVRMAQGGRLIYVGAGTNFIQCNHGGLEPGRVRRASSVE